MSKIGKKPIAISEGVTVELKDGIVSILGKEGELTLPVLEFVDVQISDNIVTVGISGSSKQARANWGTMASLITNAIEGVSKGYIKTLEIEGVGFKVAMEGEALVLNVGFSHPVKVEALPGVKLSTEKNTITVKGIDKQVVGQMAARIRRVKKPEPYKGKGIRYSDEVVRRKPGKKVAGVGAEG